MYECVSKCSYVYVSVEYGCLCDVPAPQWNFSFWIYISIWKCKCKSIGFETYTALYIYVTRTVHTFECNSIQFHPIQFNPSKLFSDFFVQRIWQSIDWSNENGKAAILMDITSEITEKCLLIDILLMEHVLLIYTAYQKKNISFSSKKWTFWLKNNISLIVDGNTFFFHLFSIDISIRSKCVHFIPRDERIQIKFWLIYSRYKYVE